MTADYKEKIRKLLALAESPNEHEARAALLKARELMAEHKLTEVELKDVDKQPVEKILTGITCSKRRNPWIVRLSTILGENYCCKVYRNHSKGKQTFTIGFIGLKDDAEICVEIFKYAVDCVLSKIKYIKKENDCYDGGYVTQLCHSYGYGFSDGVDAAFQKQKEENEQGWGLVMVIPKEVEDAANSMGRGIRFKARAEESIYSSEYSAGYEDGIVFDPTKRLAEA